MGIAAAQCLAGLRGAAHVVSAAAAGLTSHQEPPGDPGSAPIDWLMASMVVALMALPMVWAALALRGAPCQSCSNRTRNPGRRCDRCEQRAVEEQRTRDRAKAERARQQEAEARRFAAKAARARRKADKERKAKLGTVAGLQTLSWSECKVLMAELFARDGYLILRRDGNGDEGIDLVLSSGSSKDVVQFQRGKSDIDSRVIREFCGSMENAGARQGFIITTAGFSDSARAFAQGKPLTLIDGPHLVEWVNRRPKPKGEAGGASPVEESGFDPYAVLEVPRSADETAIRRAYRRLMTQYHPDKVALLGPELREVALRKSQEINRAYQMLSGR